MLNLSVLLEDSARNHPDRKALVLGEHHMTYAEVDAAANQVANVLVERGIKRGDKIALSCTNRPEFAVVYYGVLKAGAVVVPLNVLLKQREIAYHLADAGAIAYFCFEGTEELPIGHEGLRAFQDLDSVDHFFLITSDPDAADPAEGVETLSAALAGQPRTFESVATESTDTAVILYTSGTTGQAKGAELSHANTMFNVLTVNRMLQNRLATDSHVVCLPLFHTFGATVQMHAGFSTAATLHLVPRFDPARVVQLMAEEEITFFAGVPTMWWGLLRELTEDIDVARIAGNLRIGMSGGASLPVEILKEVEDRLGVRIIEGYGLSETSPLATIGDPDAPPRPGSIGRPIWGVELKLLGRDGTEVTRPGEIGEIAIRGHNVMKGYHGRPEATAEALRDGWLHTGDLARRDEDGWYYIVDRSKDMIIRGGFNVYPREVEEVLMTHPAVSLAAVVGVPHESHGEEVKAFVILHGGLEVTPAELVEWSREQMAGYKYPRIVEVVDSLPTTATGKILKRQLR
ncbi:long-chain fatty acid--CoA ligase [Streptomyces sp. NPDC047974]|uniref:long-chain-fatty-acid--CoA ligase n=1 Tax=Streptomyces sp. NPDC047974 TaxID=3154343 RepID=UPI0033D7BA3D